MMVMRKTSVSIGGEKKKHICTSQGTTKASIDSNVQSRF